MTLLMRWLCRLDEWQHGKRRISLAWYWFWRPLCNLCERWYSSPAPPPATGYQNTTTSSNAVRWWV